MRTLLLTALLLSLPSASAQGGASPATPPAVSAPAAGTVTLSLSAQPGTLVELAQTTVTRLTLEDVRVTAPDGGTGPSEAELNELRRGLQEALAQAGAQTTSGKVFYRVQERAADGTVTLLNTVVTEPPGQGPLSIRLVQTVAPDGRVTLTRIESDNPLVQSALSGLSPEALRAQSGTGGDLTGVYGQAFASGQTVTRTSTVDVQALLGSLLGSFAAGLGGGENPLGQVQASPLTVTTATTYRGVNPAGLHVFDTRTTTGAWTLDFGGAQAAGPGLRLELLEGSQGGGLSLYRPDGLPVGSAQTQAMRLRVSLTQPGGEQLQMLVRLDQTVTLRPR
ncbi:hypothetical protein [Deinococcus planocerae]|uniref:hypothetical protein n=1 Tax=Deinococcus planocerae TaxID=1737569 RepID=UPI000C7ECE47|nr:hypothetical protein [Deinococcus planocerae]